MLSLVKQRNINRADNKVATQTASETMTNNLHANVCIKLATSCIAYLLTVHHLNHQRMVLHSANSNSSLLDKT